MEEIKNNINNLEEINKESYEELMKLLKNKLDDETKKQKKLSLKKSHRKYYENNKDKVLETQHEYIKNNIERIREQQKLYRLRKKEEMKPIIEAKRLEKQRIKAEKEAEKLKNKRPVGRPRKNKDEINQKIVKDNENNDVIKPEAIKPKRGRPRIIKQDTNGHEDFHPLVDENLHVISGVNIQDDMNQDIIIKPKNKRGRPRKY